jgi:hypothetical protein
MFLGVSFWSAVRNRGGPRKSWQSNHSLLTPRSFLGGVAELGRTARPLSSGSDHVGSNFDIASRRFGVGADFVRSVDQFLGDLVIDTR